MTRLWPLLEDIPNRGANHWIYHEDQMLFVGVENFAAPPLISELKSYELILRRYAKLVHVGPYEQLQDAHRTVERGIEKMGLVACYPRVEIYGHWQEDSSKLETQILISVCDAQ